MKARSLPTLRIIVLAAGFSARLGQPKALARVHGLTLLRRTLRVLAPFAAPSKIIVVIPPAAGRYQIGSDVHSAAFLANSQRAGGLSSSVRLGLRRARHSAGALLLPVDLVDLARRDIARLIACWRGARRRVVARCVQGEPGVPLILPRWLYARTAGLKGDQGLREVVRRLPKDSVSLVVLPSAELDIDTPRDLEFARRRVRPRF
ncbi:MAG: NTP transferase domain-containing protein [Steroidobacteraceae bacterium]